MIHFQARCPIVHLLIAGCLTICFAAAAQQAAQIPFSAQIDPIVNAAMAEQKLPAVSVAIAMRGTMDYDKAFGMADLENSVFATSETLFRTGSIAKPITAVAAMQLVERGKLNLDAPVQTYCPAFPKKQWPITTRELLSHTSGIRHYKDHEIDSTKHYGKTSDGFEIFAADPLLFEPGTSYQYSTYGYSVVGCAIEGASGESYSAFVSENVLNPAGMKHTFVDDAFQIVLHRAHGYQTVDGKIENAGLMDSSYKIPGGGWVTNSEDLVAFGLALLNGKLVKPETLAMMWTSVKLPSGKSTNYGYGFGMIQVAGQSGVAHSGGQQGTSTDLIILPNLRFISAVMINMNDKNAEKLNRQIVEALLAPGAAGTN